MMSFGLLDQYRVLSGNRILHVRNNRRECRRLLRVSGEVRLVYLMLRFVKLKCLLVKSRCPFARVKNRFDRF